MEINDEKRVQNLVDRVSSSNGDAVLILHTSYPLLYLISNKAKKGYEGYKRMWCNLPRKIRDFYPGLNYINQENK
jgi:hypothetical protein